MGNSNRSQRSCASSGLLTPRSEDNQWKDDDSIIMQWTKSQSIYTDTELEECYENNNVPEEHEHILSKGPGSYKRHLRDSKRHIAKKCDCKGCKFKNNKKSQNIKMSALSSEQWAHISTHHRPLYESLRRSRSARFTRVDFKENQSSKSSHILPLKNSNSPKRKSPIKLQLKKLQQKSETSLHCGRKQCSEFKTFCNTYSIIKAKSTDADMDIYNHCLLNHIDDYPEKQCECKQWDEKSKQIQHIVHGQWFHRFGLNRLENERRITMDRQRSTPLIKYKSLSPDIIRIVSESVHVEEGKEEEYSDDEMIQNTKSIINALNAPLESEQINELQFGAPFFAQKHQAKFKNPKDEILNNQYLTLTKSEWNELLKKCILFSKAIEARVNKLSIKEIVSLKLYTDFDELQRHYRKCFRLEEEERQMQFFWWNKLLAEACTKSKDIISKKIYHGVSTELTIATFSGTYYGPVSTTTKYDVARGFAGDKGKILELYPSFGRKGLKVHWLSNFPDEEEILYMNTSFQIHNFYTPSVSAPMLPIIGGLNANNANETHFFEESVMKAIQAINIESKVISLNINDKYTFKNISKDESKESKENDTSGFIDLSTKTQLAVLYLLYLQYRKKEWTDFLQKTNKFVKQAFERFRAEFVLLAENVKAVKMEHLSNPMQIFFYTPQKKYKFPIEWYEDQPRKKNKEYKFEFKSNQPFCMDTIVRLFPNAEEISINAENWDFSLIHFISFLEKFDMDYANIKLQDIYIKFTAKKSDPRFRTSTYEIITDNHQAQKLMQQVANARQQVNKLRKLGWKFVNNSHLHRVSCEPTPELPFVMVFCKPRTNTRFFYRSYSMAIATKLVREVSTPDVDEDIEPGKNDDEVHTRVRSGFEPGQLPLPSPSALMEEKTVEEVNDEMMDGQRYVVVQHNPSNCFLNKNMYELLTYKKRLVELLNFRKDEYKTDYKELLTEDVLKANFVELCGKVETLVLDPMPDVMKNIFMEKNQKMKNGFGSNNREIISFETILRMFRNVSELFLRDTVLNLRICYRFVEFLKDYSNESLLQRVFFNKPGDVSDRHIMRFDLVLNPYGWNVNQSEYCIQKANSE